MECIHLQINKIAEKMEKKMGYGALFRVHCTFPYIEGKAVLNVKITIKWGKNQKENRDGW